MKILHFAPENFAGLPATLVKAERKLGHESFLLTLYKNPRGLTGEDFCLEMPWTATPFSNRLRSFRDANTAILSNKRRTLGDGVPVWQPGKSSVRFLFDLRDRLWESRIRRALSNLDVDSFDVIILDSGLGFLRSGKIIKELSVAGKTIVTCYYGSDLRTRGIIPDIERIASARFTFEYDHTLLYPEAKFLFFPFELPDYPPGPNNEGNSVRIGHAPTNRAAKGTDEILQVLRQLQEHYAVEIILIENLPYPEALALKSSCDIFVDTIGELGYGINSLEALAMGIPTAVQLLPDFESLLGEHPFINVSADTLDGRLRPLIESHEERQRVALRGRSWLKKTHDPAGVAGTMLRIIANSMS
jgi:hypothetical protein